MLNVPTFDVDLGNRLRNERRRQRLTQMEASVVLGISRFVLYEAEQGVFRSTHARDKALAWLAHGTVSPPPSDNKLGPADVLRLLARATTHDDVLSILRLAHGTGLSLPALIGA